MQSCSKRMVKMHYTSVLAKLQKHIAKKRPQLHRTGWRLHHDNAQPHIANQVMQFLAKFNITVLQPQTCSLWLLIFITKVKLRGSRFETSEAVLKKSEAILKDLTKNGLHHVFEEWQQRCKKRIQLGQGSSTRGPRAACGPQRVSCGPGRVFHKIQCVMNIEAWVTRHYLGIWLKENKFTTRSKILNYPKL